MAEVRKGTDIRLGRTVAIKRPAHRPGRRPDVPGTLPARGAGGRRPQPPQHRLRLRHRRGDGADGTHVQPYIVMETPGGAHPARRARTPASPSPSRWRDRPHVLEACELQPPRRHRAPRSQAGQRDDHAAGEVKVMDFGIAVRPRRRSRRPMTPPTCGVSGPRSTSPEQARGETADSAQRRLRHSARALRAAHRPAAVRRRLARVSVAISTSASMPPPSDPQPDLPAAVDGSS